MVFIEKAEMTEDMGSLGLAQQCVGPIRSKWFNLKVDESKREVVGFWHCEEFFRRK